VCADVAADVGKTLEPECAIELKEVRRSLLEDYRISPAVAEGCEADVKKYCRRVERREVIHCLMDVARHQYRAAAADADAAADGDETAAKHGRLSDECYDKVCVNLNILSNRTRFLVATKTKTVCANFMKTRPMWAWGNPPIPLLAHSLPHFSIFYSLLLFTSLSYLLYQYLLFRPFPFFQNRLTPFPDRRS